MMKKIRLTTIDSELIESKPTCTIPTPSTPVHKTTYSLNHYHHISTNASFDTTLSNCISTTPAQVINPIKQEQQKIFPSIPLPNETPALFLEIRRLSVISNLSNEDITRYLSANKSSIVPQRIMITPSQRFKSNLELASKIKLTETHWFSPELAEYVRHAASYEQMDPECLCIVLINVVATTCRNSYITRGSHFKVPLNIYNIVVARSGYGKSAVLDITERAIQSTATYFPKEFSEDDNENHQKKVPKVVFHDGSAAGILNKLKKCTKTLSFHEIDISLLKNLNVFMPSPYDRSGGGKVDPFKSTLMQLYDNPGNFTRQLKTEELDTSGSKLNIMGASTGDLFINQLVRQSTSTSADALFERIIFWPLDGVPIPNEACLAEIDFDRYPSIEQFSVICGLLGDLTLSLDDQAEQLLSTWSYNLRLAGNQERINDHLASRLAKSSHVLYRLSGLICLLESAYAIAKEYLLNCDTFQSGTITEDMLNDFHEIAEKLFGVDRNNAGKYSLVVNEQHAKRAYDVTMGNIEQYKLLMYIADDDGVNWSLNKFCRTKCNSNTVPNSNEELPVSSSTLSTVPDKFKKKMNHLKVKLLLHDSLLFIKSGLYVDRELKNASKILNLLLSDLVEQRLLIEIKMGVIGKYNTPTVYVKAIPETNELVPQFIHRLSSLNDNELTYAVYISKCKTIKLQAKGRVSNGVFLLLEQEQYRSLHVDYSSLYELENDSNEIRNSTPLSSRSVQEENTSLVLNEQIPTQHDTIPPEHTEDFSVSAHNSNGGSGFCQSTQQKPINTFQPITTNQVMETEGDNSSRQSTSMVDLPLDDVTIDKNGKRKSRKKHAFKSKNSRAHSANKKSCVQSVPQPLHYHDPICTRLRKRH